VIRKVGVANPMNTSREQRAIWAATDLSEVSDADVLWFLLPERGPTAGAYTEFGYAVMLGAMKTEVYSSAIQHAPIFWIIVSGKETSIFTALADHFVDDEAAFGALKLRSQLLGSVRQTRLPFTGEFDNNSDGG
jgi:hypothetical protein